MIFLTVGTILPFDRLTRALDVWAMAQAESPEIFAQVGQLRSDSYRPKAFEWTERITPTEFRARMAAAELTVTHAGIGTIVTALTLSTPVLMMPRRASLGEHVNDHQLETVKRLADRPGVTLAMDAEDLASRLDALLGGSAPVPALGKDAQDSLIAAIRDVIHRA